MADNNNKYAPKLDTPDEGEAAAIKKAKKKEKGPSIFSRIAKWFREQKSDLKKVVWPTFSQVVNNTWVVLVCIVILGVCLWVFDYVAGQGVNALIFAFNK